tara:strand:- start:1494 stop:2840 length:1347 start_codon:yes stop_codon:yes gene_type:complete
MPKIALVAMSGVRVKDRDLAEFGLTLPGFVERSEVIASLPSLGLLTLASHVPKNWECSYIECPGPIEEAHQQITQSTFDIVAISSLSARIFEAYKLSDQLRAKDYTVILGGLHVSALPQEAMQHADSVLQGEGEHAIFQCLQDWENGRMSPFYSSLAEPALAFDISGARVPRYDLLDIRNYNRLTLQTTRGCPLDCSFCAASKTISTFKKKPIDQIKKELDAIHQIWPTAFIELADDNTFIDKRWSLELVNALSETPFKWFTEADISIADSPELLKLLAGSGCVQILIGFESVNGLSLQNIDRSNWKSKRFDRYRESILRIQSYGISVNGCFILGHDSDDPGVFEETLNFVESSQLSEVQITLLTPFPNTRLYQQLKEENRLFKEVYWDECTLFDLTFEPKRMSANTLRSGFHSLMKELYNPAATRSRKRAFATMRHSRRDLEHPKSQ